jgi:hypothetical protein
LLSDLYREPEKDEVNLRFWLDYAIEHARKNELPIFGIRPWNEIGTPTAIADAPDYWLDWNPEAIKKGIQKHL